LWNKNEEIIIDSIWTLSFLSDGPEEYQNKIVSEGVIQKINEYSHIKIDQFQIPCLRILGNLLAGNITLIENLFEKGCFNSICDLGYDSIENIEILQEVIWCFMNLSKTNSKIINKMIEYKKFYDIIKNIFSKRKPNKKVNYKFNLKNINF